MGIKKVLAGSCGWVIFYEPHLGMRASLMYTTDGAF